MSDSIHSLSDHDVVERMMVLVSCEHEDTRSVLTGLNVVEARQLHLKLGYSSLFDYCTKGLNYSSSAAGRRIQASRCIARFPDVREMLEHKELSPSTVSQVSRVINESNREHLLARIRGKSQRQVEAILTDYQPPVAAPDRVRTVVVRVPAIQAKLGRDQAAGLFAPVVPTTGRELCEKGDYSRNGSRPEERAEERADQLQKRVMLRFTVSPEVMAKLERIRTLAWHRLPPRASLEQILEFVLDEFLARHDPVNRDARRARRHKGAAAVSEQPPVPGKSYIPAAVRDEVFKRDGGKCTFVGTSGNRCGSTLALQLDHIVPVALGGKGTADNLRLLCGKHNRLEAQRLLGVTTESERATPR